MIDDFFEVTLADPEVLLKSALTNPEDLLAAALLHSGPLWKLPDLWQPSLRSPCPRIVWYPCI